jgi:hypothetical protein
MELTLPTLGLNLLLGFAHVELLVVVAPLGFELPAELAA